MFNILSAPALLRAYRQIIYFLILLAAVEALLVLLDVPDYIFPTPTSIFETLWKQFNLISKHVGVTMIEAVAGFLVGNSLAITFGFLFSQLRILRQGLYPVIVGLQAVPIVAIAPFITIWFGPGIEGKIALAAIICYFPATVIATNGFSRISQEGRDLLLSMGASRWRIFLSLALPSAIPAITSALEVSATLCTIGAVVAELAGGSAGAGFLILRASYEFQTNMLFAVLTGIAFAAVAFFKIVQTTGKHYALKYSISHVATEL